MRKTILLMLFILFLIIIQPIALSDDRSSLNSNEICGILGVIIIIVVLIIGLLMLLTDRKDKKSMQPEKQQESSKYCPQCGRSVDFNAKFCKHCGYKLN